MWFLYIVDSQDNYTLCGMFESLDDLDKAFAILRYALRQLKNPDLMLAISYEGD